MTNTDYVKEGVLIQGNNIQIKEKICFQNKRFPTWIQEKIVKDQLDKLFDELTENNLISLNPIFTITYFDKDGNYEIVDGNPHIKKLDYTNNLHNAIKRISA